MEKKSDIVGSPAMPLGRKTTTMNGLPVSLPHPRSLDSFINTKTAAENAPARNEELASKKDEPKKHPQMSLEGLKPHVDVSDQHRPDHVAPKIAASNYALGGKYPIDNFLQVKKAAAYFDEYQNFFTPDQKREFCVNVVKQANRMKLDVPTSVRKYAGEGYADDEYLRMGISSRKIAMSNDISQCKLLDAIFEKRAELTPEGYAAVLSQYDRLHGLDGTYNKGDVLDPILSTFGMAKIAAKEDEEYRDELDGDILTGEQLIHARHLLKMRLQKIFGEEMAVEFGKDPVTVYKSLPRNERKIILRMVHDNSPGPSY